MPSKYAVNASLTEHLSNFVASQIASGRFFTASEVVRAGLRLLERDLAGAAAAKLDGPDGAGAQSAASIVAAPSKGRLGGKPRRSL